MQTLRLILAAALLLVGTAASATEVASGVADDGFFIETGSDATIDVVGGAVSDARSAGGLLYVVVLATEPTSGATAVADAVLDLVPRGEGTVLVVAPETVGWSTNNDIWTSDELDRALEASLDGASSNDVVTLFVDELTTPTSSGGGGIWIVLALLAVVGGVIAFFVWRGSRARGERAAAALAELRAKAESQVDALANDILDAEEEVSEAGDPEARDHFDLATAIYTEASERLPDATSADAIVDISADLDRGIWHLDCAEAILDGVPPPPEPTPPVVHVPTPSATPPPASEATELGVPTLPTYERRSGRRSDFGADDMLKTVIAMQALRSLGGGSRSGGSFGRFSSGGSRSGGGSRSSPSGRSRGGGRRRG